MSGNVTRGWGNSRLLEAGISKTQVDITSSTTLVSVPNLAHKLNANVNYVFQAHITGTAGASGGAKVALVADGGLVASQFSATAQNFNAGTLNAQTTTTTLGNAIGAATAAMTDIYISGSIMVSKGGTMRLQLAQNVSNGTATSALVGSTIQFFNAV